MGVVTIRTDEGEARIPLGRPVRSRRRPARPRLRRRRALGLTSAQSSRGSAQGPDPLARFIGCLDLGAADVAERHDAYLADAILRESE